MATILEGLNAISQAVGGAGEAESNLEALNQISEALGGSADATENAEAIANIAENASGGGGGGDGDLGKATVTFTYTRSGQGIYLVEMTLPLVIEGETGFEPCVMARKQSVNNKDPLVVTVPIYKKKCVIIPGNKSFTLEGNCKAGEGRLEGTIIVSGDCSITYHD